MAISDSKSPELIKDNRALSAAIAELSQAKRIAVDTEFMREKTFRAQLCLLQLATDKGGYLIDPLSNVDLSRLAPIFIDAGILKVFHAGSQDLEILFEVFGTAVTPVFDTQMAAALLGLPQQTGLASLVRHYLAVDLKKSDSFSDWAKRPLRPAQLRYALDDVRYLLDVHTKMVEALEQNGRLAWLQDDLAALSDPQRFIELPENVWRRLKGTSGLSRRQLGLLQELAIWRDISASRRNLPRRWVVTDEQLVDIARRNPSSADELYQTRGVQDRLSKRMTGEVLEAVRRGREIPEIELPERPTKPGNKLDNSIAMNMMQALVHCRASEQGIAGNILAPSDELLALAAGQRRELSILKGWRRDLIGSELLELLDGKLAMRLEQGRLVVSEVRPGGQPPDQQGTDASKRADSNAGAT
ncbi:MAG: ribonuclease D [Coriobacteriia bacterium]|nr:ribonuclease D [Coriobacteriia bacterium]